MPSALDHLTLAVDDVDAAAGPMARLLGRRPSWRGEEPARRVETVLFRLENTVVELAAPGGEGPEADALRRRLAARGPGLAGLAFATEDAAEVVRRLREHGLRAQEPRAEVGRDVQSGAFRRWRRVAIAEEDTRDVPLSVLEPASPPEILPEAPALFEEPASAFAVDHVVVRSADPEATRVLYGDVLGLRLALDRTFPQWGVRLLFFRVGGLTVEVAASLDGAEGAGARPSGGAAAEDDESAPAPGTDRLWGVSYRVRDADAARARLAGLGFDVSEVRTGRRPGTRVFTVRDAPFGVATLMLEPPPRS